MFSDFIYDEVGLVYKRLVACTELCCVVIAESVVGKLVAIA